MDRKTDLSNLINELNSAKTEEDIIECLTIIVKGFNVHEYREVVISNPFYKSLIPDIKKEVFSEISVLRNSLQDEIDEIEKELKKVDNESSEKLKSLKRDCISLIYEIDERKKDIDNLL